MYFCFCYFYAIIWKYQNIDIFHRLRYDIDIYENIDIRYIAFDMPTTSLKHLELQTAGKGFQIWAQAVSDWRKIWDSFRSEFSTFRLIEPKIVLKSYLKIPDFYHLEVIWSTSGRNLSSLRIWSKPVPSVIELLQW